MAPRRLVPVLLYASAFVVLAIVVARVADQTIDVVDARRLLPRWDLATHLAHGWMDYHFLVTGQLHRLAWDLWLQAYWPPMHSIWQVPFYVALGGGLAAGLWSSLGAFVLAGMAGTAILWRQWGTAAALPAAIFLALMTSSPYLLAYASVTMTEVPGAAAQLVVLYCYLRYTLAPGERTARWLAISLTALFFTKYNYFLLLAGPLALHEWLERAAGHGVAGMLAAAWRWARRVLATPTGAFVGLYIVFLAALTFTGGFEFAVAGQRVSVRTIGSTGHIVLYVLLAQLWYLHRRGRVDWQALFALDPRVRPLLLWFVLPVTVWFASPYPNHIRDFANLVVNRPMGEPTVRAGAATYLDALRTTYFYAEWTLAAVVVAFVAAAGRYRRQPPLMQWLLLAAPLQFAVVALHQTRFTRFLLLPVVLLCLAAAGEIGRWIGGSTRRRLAAGLVAPAVLVAGVLAAYDVTTQPRFRTVAFEHYTDSPALADALDAIRRDLGPGDRLAVAGQSNELSPGLLRWTLGPASGGARLPFEGDLDRATHVLLIAPAGDAASAEITEPYPAHRDRVGALVTRGALTPAREWRIDELDVALRLYRSTRSP